jgi:hypothetical protein
LPGGSRGLGDVYKRQEFMFMGMSTFLNITIYMM